MDYFFHADDDVIVGMNTAETRLCEPLPRTFKRVVARTRLAAQARFQSPTRDNFMGTRNHEISYTIKSFNISSARTSTRPTSGRRNNAAKCIMYKQSPMHKALPSRQWYLKPIKYAPDALQERRLKGRKNNSNDCNRCMMFSNAIKFLSSSSTIKCMLADWGYRRTSTLLRIVLRSCFPFLCMLLEPLRRLCLSGILR